MKRVFVVGGAWSLVLVIGGVCLAADTKRQGPQPASNSPQSAAAPASRSSGGLRYVTPPPNTGGVDTNRRAADARHAAQAAAAQAAAAARRAAARPVTPVRPATPSTSVSPNNGFGYGYGRYYPRYSYGFYGGYGYPTTPYGTSPYVLGYDPYSGQSYLYPYNGGYGYGYSPYGYRSPYYIPYLGFGYPGAVFANPGQLFGIGPIQQLMGVGPGFQGQPNFGPFANGAPFANANANAVNPNGANGNNNANPGFANGNNAGNAAAGNPPAAHKPAAAPGSKALDLAWQFITFGDAHFGNLKYNDALDRYRRAARECPTLADAWMREGMAMAAIGSYTQAAKAIRRGLDEKPNWADGNFRLDDIYGDNAADKKACIDRMVKASEAAPNNGDLALVVGVHLYCDGKPDQAAPFFRRSAQIQGSDATVKPFLDKLQQ